jgi:hypothetical protein
VDRKLKTKGVAAVANACSEQIFTEEFGRNVG